MNLDSTQGFVLRAARYRMKGAMQIVLVTQIMVVALSSGSTPMKLNPPPPCKTAAAASIIYYFIKNREPQQKLATTPGKTGPWCRGIRGRLRGQSRGG